ncbi:MAG: hypothetical protein COA70_10445 [Planctomycetota bacterium]|nr:MAG: hypothetical protein COA70_10445 [Planctomycetota bacterium]
MRLKTPLLAAFLIFGTASLSAQTFDDFETYSVAAGSAESVNSVSLEDTTITGTGQGPNLVMDGCTYSSTSGTSLQWNGAGWFGLPGKTIVGSGAVLTLIYDVPATSISFNMHAFDGFAGIVTVELFDAGGGLVSSTPGVNLPDSTPVLFSHAGASVKTVNIISSVNPWSAIIDDHRYSGGPIVDLTVNGTCPGPMQLSLTGATPFGTVALGYGSPGTFSIPVGSCIGTALDLNAPTLAGFFIADAAGNLNLAFSLPSAFCGLSVQAVDMATCTTSTVAIF